MSSKRDRSFDKLSQAADPGLEGGEDSDSKDLSGQGEKTVSESDHSKAKTVKASTDVVQAS